MAKVPGFAKAFAGRWRIVEMDIRLRLRNAAEFFNSLLERFIFLRKRIQRFRNSLRIRRGR